MSTITTTTLECGMTLVVEPMNAVRSVGFHWLLPGGIARDPADRIGLSTLWEEMLLRGAGERDSRAIADAFDTLGISRATGTETFTSSVRATALGARLDDALPLLVDMVRAPAFNDLAASRDLCLQALDSLLDNPQERLFLSLRAAHAPTPINRATQGTREGIEAVTEEDLRLWSSRAVPEGAILAVAGDVDPNHIADRLNTLLEGWTGTATDLSWNDDAPRGMHHEPDQTDQTHIAIAMDAPPETDETNAWLCRVATAVLSGGMSGRLFTEVREKRSLCYAVYATYGAEARYGRVVAYSGTTPDRAQETLDVLLSELQRIRTPEGRITPDEFRRAVVGLKSRLVFSGESSAARAAALAGDIRKLGRARSLDEMAERIDAVTLDDLNASLEGQGLGTITVATIGRDELRL
ncbi:MAG: pitrilysin family protein [Planctomycetota bacterium]